MNKEEIKQYINQILKRAEQTGDESEAFEVAMRAYFDLRKQGADPVTFYKAVMEVANEIEKTQYVKISNDELDKFIH